MKTIPFGKLLTLFNIRSNKSFVIEVDKDSPNEDAVATVKDLQDMLYKCPKSARVAFGVNEGGNMRLLLDTFLHYNQELNEVVLYPFNRPTVEEDKDLPDEDIESE